MGFPFHESILEEMIGPNKVCEDLHHKSYFLPELRRIESSEFHVRLSEGVSQIVNHFPKEGLFTEENTENISKIIPINISTKPNVVENVYIRANSSLKEIATYTTLFNEFRDVFS